MSAAPKISVVMAVYNGANQIGGAVASLFAQSFADWELLVIDDASSDDASAVVKRLAAGDARVSYHRLPHNVGPGGARNVALACARGEWITVLDSDDGYAPDRLQTLFDYATRESLDVLADNLILYDEHEDISLGAAFALQGEACALTCRRLVANDCPPNMIVMGQLKPFVRRAFLTRTGVRYAEDIRVGEDFQFLFDLLERTPRAALINYAGYRYTLPFSPRAGRQSAGTRTSHGPQVLADLTRGTQRLIARCASTDPRLAALLRKRQRRLRDEAIWRRARARVHARDYGAASLLLTQLDPVFGWKQAVAIFNRRRGRIQAVVR